MSQSDSSREAWTLGELLPGAEIVGPSNVRVRSCASDSRICSPGDLFVAIAGSRSDGRAHVDEAVARGAAAIVAEQPLAAAVPVCVVRNSREALGHICQTLAGRPSREMSLIAVTGTNGKTTTTHLVASILRAAGRRSGMLSTLEYSDGVDAEPSTLTTPAAPQLASWLARMKANDCSHAVLEVSSHAVDQRRIAGLQFAQVCLTNLRQDHLDYHESLAAYHAAKLDLFHRLDDRGTAIVNVDDPRTVAHLPRLSGRVVSVAMQREADLSARLVERQKSEQIFMLTCGQASVPVRTATIGDHHIYNCLLAAAVGTLQGIELPTIVAGLEAVKHLPGRLERIECGQPFGVYVDFAHTPDALTAVLDALREVTVGRLLCVFGAGGNRDAAKRPQMGRAVEAVADRAIVTADNPRFEDPRTIAAEIMAGFAEPSRARWMPDRRAAIHYALGLAGPDDCVLIAGRGHERDQVVGETRIPLDDREIARDYLYNLAPRSRYGSLASAGNS